MRFGKRVFPWIAITVLACMFTCIDGCAPSRVQVSTERWSALDDSAAVRHIFNTPTNWMNDRLSEMTLREKVSQLIMVRAMGYYSSDKSPQFERLVKAVRDKKVGGICLFQSDVHSSAVLLNRLQSLSKIPLLVSADFEWGAAMRIRRSTRFPEAMALAATRDTVLAYRMGYATASEARAIGVHQIYAPVADVNTNPDNPVINTRSFGEQPGLVADMAVAFMHGLQAGGVIATAKHFPGHGDTDVDSHLGLPVITRSRSALDSIDLVPFRRLIAHGVASVMVGHFRIPALEHDGVKLPATMSRPVVTKLLNEELGFDGLVVTDALEMGALVNSFNSDSIAVLALDAGNDILLLPADDDATVDAILAAVRRGRISEERINHSVKKILAIKQWLHLDEGARTNPEQLGRVVEVPDHMQVARQIARASITVLRNDGVLPLGQQGSQILNVIVSDIEDYRTEIQRPDIPWPNERSGDYLTSQLRRRIRNIATVRVDPSTNSAARDSILRLAANAQTIVVPIYSKVRSASGKFGLPRPIIDFINRLTTLKKPIVLLAMGSPYVLRSFPDASAHICAYSDAEPTAEAVVEVMFGEVPMAGRLPVTIPDLYPFGSGLLGPQLVLRRDLPENVGFNPDSLALVDSILTRAIADSAFPGAQVVVVRNGALVANVSIGKLEYSRGSTPVNSETMYDIASLTKVVATTSAIMRLYDEGKVGLDDIVARYVPEFANRGKERLTIRHLLLHNGGLPPFKRLFLTCTSPQQVLDSVYQTELVYRPGDSTLYSDFDFIVLGKIVERISNTTLDSYVDSVFFRPLGMGRTMFTPDTSFWDNVAPTEYDSVYRKRLVKGVVHDENAFILGGIAGHAGLFSTASDLAIFMQMMMNGGTYGGVRFLKPETVRLFTSKQNASSTQALGWDTKTVGGYSTAGSLFSEKSFGHTGFTGTSIWADPEKKIFVILLTNRVYPTRNNAKIRRVRPAVADAIVRAITP